jgi:hypothetical protein
VPASAAKLKTFDVTFKGSASYKTDFDDGVGNTTHVKGDFTWKTVFKFLFAGSDFGYQYFQKKSSVKGDWTASNTSSAGAKCTGSGTLAGNDYTPGVRRKKTSSAVWLAPQAFSPYGLSTPKSTGDDCSSSDGKHTDFWNDWIISNGVGDKYPPIEPEFKLKKSQLKKSKIVVPVKVVPAEKPSPTCGAMCTQSWDWSGTITMKRGHK